MSLDDDVEHGHSSSRLVFDMGQQGRIIGRALPIPFSIQFRNGWIKSQPLWSTNAVSITNHHSVDKLYENAESQATFQSSSHLAYWSSLFSGKLKSWVLRTLAATKDGKDVECIKTVHYQFPLPSDVVSLQLETLGPRSDHPDQALACALINRSFEIFDPENLTPLGLFCIPEDKHIRIVSTQAEANTIFIIVRLPNKEGEDRFFLVTPTTTGADVHKVFLPAFKRPRFISHWRLVTFDPRNISKFQIPRAPLDFIKVLSTSTKARLHLDPTCLFWYERYRMADFIMFVVHVLDRVHSHHKRLGNTYSTQLATLNAPHYWDFLHESCKNDFRQILDAFVAIELVVGKPNDPALSSVSSYAQHLITRHALQ